MFSDLLSPVELEADILAFWRENDIFEEGLRISRGRPEWIFYEGPPTANGLPHNGHVLTRVIKDLFPRYKTMRGFHVRRKAGWDTHGLPVEVEVEKTLGIHGREAIEAYGLEPFARKCIDSVFTYTKEWEELTERIGFWINLPEAYVTYHRSYVESVWWALSQLFQKGLLYQSHKVVWWWPQGGTALSAGEVGQGYKTVDDPSVIVRFPVEGQPGLSLLAWTTTPWTLPSNTAIAVGPELDYAVVAFNDERLIVAAALVETVFKGHEVQVLSTMKGAELVGWRYQGPYSFDTPVGGDGGRVIGGDFVSLDSGTGLVHTAPAFGEDDFRVAKLNGIGLIQLVEPNGNFSAKAGWLAGKFCKDADNDIIRDLKDRGLLFKRETYRHDYPFCWRADSDPLIQYARPAWFIRTTALNAEALANNQAVRWLPEHVKEGRFGDFLRNNVDWALSRERFWGTPLNIWRCPDCGAMHAPASTAEIRERNPDAFDPTVDEHLQVHRPWIDRVTLPCACGGTMVRVPEVIDCWFDSGCMPFAQWGFPHQGVEEFKASFPADFISEAVDQTRGWFYSLLMISTLLFDKESCEALGLGDVGEARPYKTCMVLGHVCDMDGKKESKSKGNYTSPDLVMTGRVRQQVVPDARLKPGQLGLKEAQVRALDLGAEDRFTATGPDGQTLALEVVVCEVKGKDIMGMHPEDIAALGLSPEKDGATRVNLKAPFEPPGADAFRWLFTSSNPPWNNTRLSLRAIREGQRDFLMRLKNVHSFFTIYANIAGFDPNAPAARAAKDRGPLDRWILHELNTVNAQVIAALDEYLLYDAAQALRGFVESLSNWYVRRSRDRFWGEGPETQDALTTLYEVLTRLTRLIAPFVPFTAEAMYLSLEAGQREGALASVHHTAYPTPDADGLAPELAEDMALLRELASLGLAARKSVGVRVRQPLRALEVILARPERAERLTPLLPLLLDELNVREIRFSQEPEKFVEFKVKANFKALGKRLGKDMKLCQAMITGMDPAAVRRAVLGDGLRLTLPSGEVVLGLEEVVVEVSPREHFQAAGSASAVVALHADLDDDLREEGLAREVLSRVQGLRRELMLGYTQRIDLSIDGDAALVKAAERFRDHLSRESLVRRWGAADGAAEARALDVDGLPLILRVSPV